MRGKLIVVEGTDCSGKETQTKKLVEKLTNDGRTVKRYSFPFYESPTGKIIGGPYLGKSYISDGWFPEGATNVDYKVASLYYAADRLYNINTINKDLENGIDVILDRYVYSNMAHQGAKIENKQKRLQLYSWLEELEFNFLELPIPDIKIFLHMPTEYSKILKQNRIEAPDEHEQDENHLKSAERAYLEIVNYYNFKTIECVSDNKIRNIDNISDELYNLVNSYISYKIK